MGIQRFEINGVPFEIQDAQVFIHQGPVQSELEQAILRYTWHMITVHGHDYIWLGGMSRQLGVRYDLCETIVTQLMVRRLLPRLEIVEEVEG